jgi:hypothetical protein
MPLLSYNRREVEERAPRAGAYGAEMKKAGPEEPAMTS